MSDEPVLALLRRLLPEWTITRDVHGVWRATGRTHVAASSVEGLVDVIRRHVDRSARQEPSPSRRFRL